MARPPSHVECFMQRLKSFWYSELRTIIILFSRRNGYCSSHHTHISRYGYIFAGISHPPCALFTDSVDYRIDDDAQAHASRTREDGHFEKEKNIGGPVRMVAYALCSVDRMPAHTPCAIKLHHNYNEMLCELASLRYLAGVYRLL